MKIKVETGRGERAANEHPDRSSQFSRVHLTIKLFLKYSHITDRWYANIVVPGLCRPFSFPDAAPSPTYSPIDPAEEERRLPGSPRIPGFARGGMSAYHRDNDWQQDCMESDQRDDDNPRLFAGLAPRPLSRQY